MLKSPRTPTVAIMAFTAASLCWSSLLPPLSRAAAPAPATQPATQPAKPAPLFENVGGHQRVLFVCEGAGSMLPKMATLKHELAKTVASLGPEQSFGIIFFQDQSPLTLDKERLLPATAENKKKAMTFLDDVATSGPTDPLPGLRLAFQVKPQVIYLLADGDFPDNAGVLYAIRKLNAGNATLVNTIAYTSDKDTDTEFLATLKAIAKESGGTFQRADEAELAKEPD